MAGDWKPQRAQEASHLRPFYSVRDRLAVTQDMVTYTYDQGSVRLVIPEALSNKVAANLHAGYEGLDSMLRRARHAVYWPGIEGDLQHHRAPEACETRAPSQPPETLVLTPPKGCPFHMTVVDMFQNDGHVYMAYADRLIGWLDLAYFPNGTSQRIK